MLAGRTIAAAVCLLLTQAAHAQQQIVDPDFKPVVTHPVYASNGPVVAIDEAHQNFHTATGNYRPFAELLRADGYRVRASTSKFSAETFRGVDIFVVVNAEGTFTDTESDALRDWVKAGGSLLLTADHEPFGAAKESLASRFGVSMGKGRAYDSEVPGTITTQLTYSRANGLLGEHPIMDGRDASEKVSIVKTFTGQSLGLPQGASPLLRFSATARETLTTAQLGQVGKAIARNEVIADGPRSVAGRVQGLAMPFGNGRVVVLGEAGMFSAQAVKFPPGSGQLDFKFGMNEPGTDDRQFALNVLHWLSRVIG